MKYFFLLLLLIPFALIGQDKKVSALPADTVVQPTDLLYIIDQGTTSKKMTISRILNVLNDTADQVRSELADTATQLRSEISGISAFSKSGNYIYPTSNNDSVSVGTTMPLKKFWVAGDIGTTTNLWADTVYVIGNGSGSGWFTGTGDNLKLGDNNNSTGVALSTLMTGGGAFGLGNLGGTYFYYTLNPTYNWNFGAIAPTNSKFKVTGTFNVTDDATFDDYIRLGAYSYLYPQNIGALSTIRLGTDASTGFWDFDINSNDAMSILNGDDVGINFSRTDLSFSARTSVGGAVGYFYFDGDSVRINPANGVDYVLGTSSFSGIDITLNECSDCDTVVVVHGDDFAYKVGGATGTGIIDTTGLPVAGQLPVFTAANKIGGYDELTWQTGTQSLYVGDASAKSQIDGSYLSVFISDVEKTTLSPGLAASANTYLFGTTNSRTTGIHTRFIDNTQDLMYLYRDSAVIYQDLHLRDSTYYEDLKNGKYQWLGITPTGAAFADSLANAGFMLNRFYIPKIKDYLKDCKDGELLWLYKENGQIKTSRGLSSLKPVYQVQALMAGVERSLLYIDELETRVTELEKKVRDFEKQTPEGKNKTWLILIFSAIVVFTIVYTIKK